MPIPSTSDLPKPKSWDEFEDIVWEVYTRKWQDPYAQRYGRSGQAQNGIDIYGQQNSSKDYIAVQCKRYEDKKLNIPKIIEEVTKAESFSSPISEYLIATTASRDTKLQDFLRILNEERKSEGKFAVHIIFWEDLCSYLAHSDNYDLLRKYYAEWEKIFSSQQKQEEKKAASIRSLFRSEIQQDYNLLQEIIDHDEKSYLSDKWQSCLSQNRSIWQDIPTRMVLDQSGGELIQQIHNFYKQLDNIEDHCKDILALKSEIQSLESKPGYGNGSLVFDCIPPPAWAEKYFTEADAIALICSKKKNSRKLIEMKKVIRRSLDLGNQIINELNR